VSPLPAVKPRQVVAVLKRIGYAELFQTLRQNALL